MLISVSKIEDKSLTELHIAGSEEWLKPVLESFAGPEENCDASPALKGDLRFKSIAEGAAYHVSGAIEFSTFIACNLCNQPHQVLASSSISAVFQAPPADLESKKLRDLNAGELDQYYLTKKNEVDLASLLIDSINDQLPTVLSCHDATGIPCFSLPNKDSQTPIFSTEDPLQAEGNNPFAELAKFKPKN